MSKRQAGVQLTKDDYDRQDDEDRYGPPIAPGTWQKADDETLKKRVIRKAKRPTGAGGLPLPPANPFASVQLDAPAPSANPFASVQLSAPPAASNPFANLELVPTKAQKTRADASAPLTHNPFASVQLAAPPAAAAPADPSAALRERLHAVRQARMHLL